MILLTIEPHDINNIILRDNLLIKIEFNIDDQLNMKEYFGKYINITIKKVGTSTILNLYPLKYNNNKLFWDFYPTESGTFTINAVIQNENNNILTTTNLIIQSQNIIRNVNTFNNINLYTANNNIIKAPVYKSQDEFQSEYNKSKIT